MNRWQATCHLARILGIGTLAAARIITRAERQTVGGQRWQA